MLEPYNEYPFYLGMDLGIKSLGRNLHSCSLFSLFKILHICSWSLCWGRLRLYNDCIMIARLLLISLVSLLCSIQEITKIHTDQLQNYPGFQRHALRWFAHLNGSKAVKYRVPQGSVLGPLVFFQLACWSLGYYLKLRYF